MDSVWKNPVPPFQWPNSDRKDIDLSLPAGECYMDDECGIYPEQGSEVEPGCHQLDEEDEWERECVRHELFD
jgi:hypothetical protein